MEHLSNPRNVGRIADADAVGEVESREDGDIIVIYIKVQDNAIADITFQTFGCAAAIATASMLTELAKGKTLDDAKKITQQDVADALGGIPAWKMECSNIACNALRDAIAHYEGQSFEEK
jgi:nitrogen fixation NifU-like protein